MSNQKVYQRQWAIENKDKVNAASRRYRKRYPERHAVAAEKWRQANRDRVNARTRERYGANPEKYRIKNPRAHHLKTRYGLTEKVWNAMFQAQGRRCAACGTKKSGCVYGWCTDHCHKTERVRGILCHSCNLLLGHLRDDLPRLYGLLAYLEKENA